MYIVVQSYSNHSNYCATSDTNLELTVMADLPTNQSTTVDQDLFNTTDWNIALSSAASTLTAMVPNTVAGTLSEYQGFRNWTYANMPDPPSWISTGFQPYLQAILMQLEKNVTSAESALQARQVLKGFFASIAGESFTALDFVSSGGITGLETYFDTGSASQAVCATFPGQLAELYILSGSSNLTGAQRAQYLGQVLAITAVMVALAGHDDFTDKFKAALDNVGLLDSWPTIKPYLSEILTTVSQRAAMLTFSILQKIAERFPQNSVWYTGLTADRMASMADNLQVNGVSTSDIEARIQGLVEVADNAQNGDDVANAADLTDYQTTGQIEVVLVHHSELYLYYDNSASQPISAQFLSEVVQGFQPGTKAILRVSYWDTPTSVGAVIYHYYQGGQNWYPTVPSDVADQGDVLTISIQILTAAQFVADLPGIDFTNLLYTDWGGAETSMTGFTLTGNDLQIQATQWDDFAGVSSFTIDGTVDGPLSFVGGTTSLDVTLTDAFGQTRDIRINYDGHTSASLGIWDSDSFATVQFISFDGVRLRFATIASSNNVDVATIWVNPPSSLYSFGSSDEVTLGFPVPYASQAFEIEHVDFSRQLEYQMLNDGTSYDKGILGAEIAYTVLEKDFGLKDMIILPPNLGGNDLISADGSVIVQARLITYAQQSASLNEALASELSQMTNKLHGGFKLFPQASVGYAILAYVDGPVIKVVIVEVLPS